MSLDSPQPPDETARLRAEVEQLIKLHRAYSEREPLVDAILTLVERVRLEALAEPPLSQHAIRECNEAHVVLDECGAPKMRSVPNRAGAGEQDVTLGLRDRLVELKRRLRPGEIEVEQMRANLHATFNGGWAQGEPNRAFHQGLDTVCNVLAEYQRGEHANGIIASAPVPDAARGALTPRGELIERLETHAIDLLSAGGTNASSLRADLREAAALLRAEKGTP